MTPSNRRPSSLFLGVDKFAVALYVLLVAAGVMSVISSSYDESSASFFAFSHFYIKQAIWAGVAMIAALFVLLIDVSSFHKYSYPLYALGIFMLLLTFIPGVGKEVNGARAWLGVGSFTMQPVEIVKITTALAMARVMSDYSYNINRRGDMLKVAAILMLPLLIIVMQNDTGSGIVLGSFIFVLYREGLNKWLIIPLLLIVLLFIISFLLSPLLLLILSVLVLTLCDMMINGSWRLNLIYLAAITAATIILSLLSSLLSTTPLELYESLLWVVGLSLPVVVVYAFRKQLTNTVIIVGMFLLTMIFLPTTEYIFNSILQDHQQKRILTFLGLVDDPLGTGYNVNQSKIAIGSGGLTGKGFLQGTQIRYGFVPERHTDFIFCSLGEEWGFVGACVVLVLFAAMILRLIYMGERQEESFARVYCYAVASILLFHVLVNVGMTIGLMPVMGIPLPLMSYGGSSLVAFTILIFIAIRLDSFSHRDQSMRH
ncbi:MAG: rod shape-determining protein RodA [Rikenellaceae bacterium]